MRRAAREIVREFARSGAVSEESENASGFGEWSRLTPAWVLFAALKLEVMARQDAGDAPERIAGELTGSVSRDAGMRLVSAVMGDMREVRRPAGQSVVTLENIVTALSAAWSGDAITDADIDSRLAAAEQIASESVRLMVGAKGAGRGRDTGPWDIGELGDAAAGRVDLGGLLVPVGAGVTLDPVYAGADGPAVAVTLYGDGSALQLQAYRARPERPWHAVRAQLCRSVTESGGTAVEWAGPEGFEVRARQPIVSDGGPREMDVRFVGCDGPGWLLRATVTGRGAEQGSVGGWAYEVFRDTVVNPGFTDGAGSDVVPLCWPPK